MAKTIRVDIVSDTVCPWCYIGKRRLEAAIQKYRGAGNQDTSFEIKWHPFQLNPGASEEGVNKRQFYRQKFGQRSEGIITTMTETFAREGLQYNMDGLTGNTLNSHRLIALAGNEGPEKQNALVEALFKAYFTEGKFINDRAVLLRCADSVGLKDAESALQNESTASRTVKSELQEVSGSLGGVPHFTINSKYQLSGAQEPAAFLNAFERA